MGTAKTKRLEIKAFDKIPSTTNGTWKTNSPEPNSNFPNHAEQIEILEVSNFHYYQRENLNIGDSKSSGLNKEYLDEEIGKEGEDSEAKIIVKGQIEKNPRDLFENHVIPRRPLVQNLQVIPLEDSRPYHKPDMGLINELLLEEKVYNFDDNSVGLNSTEKDNDTILMVLNELMDETDDKQVFIR